MAVSIVLAGVTPAVADTGPTTSSESLTRDAGTGALLFDVHTSVENFYSSGQPCAVSAAYCTLELDAQFVDGATAYLASQPIPSGSASPYGYDFTGTAVVSKVISVRVILIGFNTVSYGAWKHVNDPYLTPTVSVSVGSVGRDSSSGNFTYDLTATEEKAQTPAGVCGTGYCIIGVEAQPVNGGDLYLTSESVPSGAGSPFSPEFTGTIATSKIAAVRSYIQGYLGISYSDWKPVTDPYLTSPVSVSAGSIGRDASTGNFTYDLTATEEEAQTPAGICGAGNCIIGVEAQPISGGDLGLKSASVPSGAGSPFSVEFSGTIATSKIAAVRSYVLGSLGISYGDWEPVTDPLTASGGGATTSISVNAISRNSSTGQLVYDVDANESGAMPSGVCSIWYYACYLGVQAKTARGDIDDLNSIRIDSSTTPTSVSHNFVASQPFDQIVAVRATASGSDGFVYGSWVNVTDPYPSASISLSIGSISRDASSGKLIYDVTATQSSVWPSAECPNSIYSCSLSLQAKTSTGDVVALDSANYQFGTNSPHSEHFTGTKSFPEIVSLRATLSGAGVVTRTTDWTDVTDPYPAFTVSAKVAAFGRNAAGGLSFDVKAIVSGEWQSNRACTPTSFHCWLDVQAKTVKGDIVNLAPAHDVGGTTATLIDDFSGVKTVDQVDSVRAILTGNGEPEYSEWQNVRSLDPSESLAASNASQKGCGCKNGDPVDTETGDFFDTATDLGVPGVGPAVSVSRTYSSLNAAADGPFGFGWSTSFTSQLVVDTAGDSSDPLPRQVHIVQENGATVSFSENSSGLYPADPWVLASLTHDSSTGDWTLTRTKGVQNILVFNSDGELISASDLNGNTVEYHYSSGHVTSITGSGGREIDLNWSSGRVSTIQDTAGRVVAFGYDSSGNLITVDAADSGLWSYTYDSSHLLLTQVKPAGGVLTNVYNAYGQVTSQTDEVGRETDFSYTGDSTTVTLPDGSVNVSTYNQGQLASLTTAVGTPEAATTTYDYNAAGDKVSVTDPLGRMTSYTYDSAGNPLTTTDPMGKVTTRTYDSLNDVLTVEDPLGRTSTMTYDSAGNMTSLETPGGHTTTLSLNANGTVDTSSDARGKTTSHTYDGAGRPLCVTDPDGRQSCQSYDTRGLATTKTDAAGKATTVTYDDAGRPLTVTDPNSHTTTYQYDDDGNLTSTEDSSGHTTTAAYDHADQRTSTTDGRGKTTTYTYTPRGSLSTVTDPNGHVTTNAYDAQNQLTSVTDPDGHVTSFTYDLAGHKLSTTMPSTAVTSSTYDAHGRVATTTDALGKVTAYAYDDAGELHSTTDPMSRVTTYSYTDDGKLHVTTLPDSSTETYAYNADDAQTSFTNADGDVTTYSYDDAGLLSSETQPGGMTTSYSYDAAGRIHSVMTPDGVVATRSYDDGGRLTGVNYPGSADDVSYTYFANGSRHTMTDGTGTTTYAYNANAALTSVQNGDGQSIGYGYDDASQLTSITYPGSKTVSYGYDNAGNMTSVTDWASRTTTLTVTADGLQNTRTDPSGVTETRSYNANDQLTDISTATTSATLSDYGYGYDYAGQLTSSSLTDAIHTTTATNTWGYTNLGQLSSTGPSTGYTTTPAGELTATPAGDAFTYNSKQELASATNTSAGTTTAYSYNDNGSRTSTATTTSGVTATVSYDYDARGNLTSVTTGGTTVSYQSDGDGLRQSRTVGTTTSQFLWDPNRGIPLLLDDGTDSYIYATSTTPIAQIDNSTGTIEYLHADNVGSVRTITSATGIVVGTTDFNPYGLVTSHTGTSNSNFGYATAWTDATTGLDYLRAREYDPTTAQFVQVDPAVDQTRQPYEYVAGKPNSSDDPTGLCLLGGSNVELCMASTVAAQIWGGPIAAGALADADCIVGGKWDAWTCTNMTFNPVDLALTGYGNEIADSEAGCPIWQIALDGGQGVMGVAGTVGIATGVAGVAGATESVDASAASAPARFVVNSDGVAIDMKLATPEGRPYSYHVQNDHPDRNVPGWVVDEAIDHGSVTEDGAGETVYYDAKNNVTVVLSKTTGKIVSARKGGSR